MGNQGAIQLLYQTGRSLAQQANCWSFPWPGTPTFRLWVAKRFPSFLLCSRRAEEIEGCDCWGNFPFRADCLVWHFKYSILELPGRGTFQRQRWELSPGSGTQENPVPPKPGHLLEKSQLLNLWSFPHSQFCNLVVHTEGRRNARVPLGISIKHRTNLFFFLFILLNLFKIHSPLFHRFLSGHHQRKISYSSSAMMVMWWSKISTLLKPEMNSSPDWINSQPRQLLAL